MPALIGVSTARPPHVTVRLTKTLRRAGGRWALHRRREGGTVEWPNGADIAPETLYERAKLREAG